MLISVECTVLLELPQFALRSLPSLTSLYCSTGLSFTQLGHAQTSFAINRFLKLLNIFTINTMGNVARVLLEEESQVNPRGIAVGMCRMKLR